jgi:hypothetical protein
LLFSEEVFCIPVAGFVGVVGWACQRVVSCGLRKARMH